jgi:hypothetical protein
MPSLRLDACDPAELAEILRDMSADPSLGRSPLEEVQRSRGDRRPIIGPCHYAVGSERSRD